MDTGFTGYSPHRTDVLMRHQKPKEKPLGAVGKTINRALSRLWVGIEHTLAEVKRCHIFADIYRNTKAGFEDAACSWLADFKVYERDRQCKSMKA